MLWCLIEKIIFKFGFEKGVFLTKFNFYIKHSMGISGKGLLHSYQETSSLIGNQPTFNHRTNIFSPYQSKIVSEYVQEIPQSQTAVNPVAP